MAPTARAISVSFCHRYSCAPTLSHGIGGIPPVVQLCWIAVGAADGHGAVRDGLLSTNPISGMSTFSISINTASKRSGANDTAEAGHLLDCCPLARVGA